MDKAYDPKQYEDGIYKRWETSGYFNPDNLSGEPYSIMMPPPNVTGVLHLGHALENSLMDTMARFQRMNGKKVLLLPGTDHAALPTQAKVEKLLMQEGITSPRVELGREKLVEKIRDYAENSKSTILGQIKKMGTSCDWSRLAYTFDESRNKAVKTVFKKMYDDGLIYRGLRVVNWSVKGQSTCSDDELVHVNRPAKLYTFKYSKDFPITIATTRPETKLGDTAVAVNSTDARYKKFIGKEYEVEVGADQPLKLKIIADDSVEKDFGTGALGVTPAHSAVDFEMYEKQKAKGDPIGIIPVIGEDGKMLKAAGKDYAGLKAEAAREKFVGWLKDNGLLEKEEEITQSAGASDRFGDVVEALPKIQWWLDVNKIIPGRKKSLKDLMREAVTIGLNNDSSAKVTITPENFAKPYLDRVDNLRDWCLSRQIWWGHRIPVWYKGNKIFVGVEAPTGEGWVQDEDSLDTWFSSGTWTFSTLGWPDEAKDMQTFHPTTWMQMGYEIRYLWMMRMILMSAYLLDEVPFKDVYFHGMLRDESGKKFSKSSGNNIDPLDVIKEYGADALRWSTLSGITPGNDSKFYEEKIEGARNLVNKIWNISRFIQNVIPSGIPIRIGTQSRDPLNIVSIPKASTLADKWILERLNQVVASVNSNLNSYNFSFAGEELREFTWSKLADWYLEISKIEGNKREILNYLLNILLKLWHPYIPFVTEAIWQEIYSGKELLMMQKYPTAKAPPLSKEVELFDEYIINIVTDIRSLRAENKIEQVKLLSAVISAGDQEKLLKDNSEIIRKLGRLEDLKISAKAAKPVGSVGFVVGEVEVYINLAGVVDVEKEKARLQKEIEETQKYANGLGAKLGNADFVARAPEAVVNNEKKKLEEAKNKLEKLISQFSSL